MGGKFSLVSFRSDCMRDSSDGWTLCISLNTNDQRLPPSLYFQRQSYYDSIFSLATSILEDAECYMALKGHIQRVRLHDETDPIPRPREEPEAESTRIDTDLGNFASDNAGQTAKLKKAIADAKKKIEEADKKGARVVRSLLRDEKSLLRDEKKTKASADYSEVINIYREAFDACSRVRALDKLAFQTPWFREFYKRNYDALMIKSMYDNVVDNVDKVRYW
jgi:hypothetical protein